MSRKRPSIDYVLLLLTGALLLVGIIMLWSASTVESEQNFGNTSHYVMQSVYGIAIGLAAMYIFSRIDYHFWKKIIPFALIASLLALILVKVPGIGFSANGATRWIHLGPLFFQPSEPAKLAIIMYLAGWISTQGAQHKNFWQSVFPPLIIIGLFSLLILWQPDMGTMLSLLTISMTMLFVGGIRLKYFAWIAVSGVLALIMLIKLEPYRMRRITAFLNPEGDPLGIAYQINQAMLAIGSGGWFGYGYGGSRQKYFYLPEAINDSIFAVIAEELGFIRVLLILLLFLAFILRGLLTSLRAPDNFGKLLAIGIVAGIGANTVINIAAILGLLPLTGIPLPFFSYGSSAMVITLSGLGILFNISRQGKKA